MQEHDEVYSAKITLIKSYFRKALEENQLVEVNRGFVSKDGHMHTTLLTWLAPIEIVQDGQDEVVVAFELVSAHGSRSRFSQLVAGEVTHAHITEKFFDEFIADVPSFVELRVVTLEGARKYGCTCTDRIEPTDRSMVHVP